MLFMIECSTGDVVLLPFPFTDFSTAKQRPALIISSNRWNSSGDDVIVAAITSKIRQSKFEYIFLDTELSGSGGIGSFFYRDQAFSFGKYSLSIMFQKLLDFGVRLSALLL